MADEKITCIDFGSAYTKVAVRKRCNCEADLVLGLPSASKGDNTFCVPSVVAKINGAKGATWKIGDEAAGLTGDGDRVQLFRYFKNELFSEAITPQRLVAVTEAAVQFFKLLISQLATHSNLFRVDRHDARICIPKLENDALVRQRILNVLQQAGWRMSETRPFLYEPEANAIGIFTRGRNATSREGSFQPHYLSMFYREGLLGKIREGVFTQRNIEYTILAVDVGAFTTDLGYITFETDYNECPRVNQFSLIHGIAELDEAVKQVLGPAIQNSLRTKDHRFWEINKIKLYAGEEFALIDENKKMRTVGGAAVNKAVKECAKNFAQKLIEEERRIRKENKLTVNAITITGGGAMIGPIREALLAWADSEKNWGLFNMLDPMEPDAWIERLKDPRTGRNYPDPVKWNARLEQNRRLVRAGSALGGCSVFFI